jgi:post-segregation antitoxin (ccd killing protein)
MSERGLSQDRSSDQNQFTRVKSHRKEAKTTVGITLSPSLIAEARKHRLNISRITDQALNSILDYLAQPKRGTSARAREEPRKRDMKLE